MPSHEKPGKSIEQAKEIPHDLKMAKSDRIAKIVPSLRNELAEKITLHAMNFKIQFRGFNIIEADNR